MKPAVGKRVVPPSSGSGPGGMEPLFQYAGRLWVCYLAITALFLALILFLTLKVLVDLLADPSLVRTLDWSILRSAARGSMESAIFVVLFIVAFVAFVGPERRNAPRRAKHNILTVLVFGAFLIALSLILCADFFLATQQTAYDPNLGPAYGTYVRRPAPIVVGLVVTIGSFLAFRYGRRETGWSTPSGLSAVSVTAAWIVFSATVPVHVIVSELGQYRDVARFSAAALIGAFAMFLWALGPALYLLRKRRVGDDGFAHLLGAADDLTATKSTVSAQPYVASARNVAIVLLVLTCVSWEVARQHRGDARLLSAARDLFARHYAFACLKEDEDPKATNANDAGVGPCALQNDSQSEAMVLTKNVEKVGKVELRVIKVVDGGAGRQDEQPAYVVTVSSADGSWRVIHQRLDYYVDPNCHWITKGGIGRIQCGGASYALKWDRELRDIADFADVKGDGEFDRVYARIERKLLSQSVDVPTLDVKFRLSEAAWLIAFFVLISLVLLRNQIGFALRDPGLGRGEPWLLIDEGTGLERWLAAAWLLAIFLSAWLVGGFLMSILTSQVHMEGILTFKPIWCFGLLLVSGWVSATAAARLLILRHRRAHAEQREAVTRLRADRERKAGP